MVNGYNLYLEQTGGTLGGVPAEEIAPAVANLDLLKLAAPRLLIGMCMDSRKSLRIPNDFAFVLRTAGANMRARYSRFSTPMPCSPVSEPPASMQ